MITGRPNTATNTIGKKWMNTNVFVTTIPLTGSAGTTSTETATFTTVVVLNPERLWFTVTK